MFTLAMREDGDDPPGHGARGPVRDRGQFDYSPFRVLEVLIELRASYARRPLTEIERSLSKRGRQRPEGGFERAAVRYMDVIGALNSTAMDPFAAFCVYGHWVEEKSTRALAAEWTQRTGRVVSHVTVWNYVYDGVERVSTILGWQGDLTEWHAFSRRKWSRRRS